MKNVFLFLTALTVVIACTLESTMPVAGIPDKESLNVTDFPYPKTPDTVAALHKFFYEEAE